MKGIASKLTRVLFVTLLFSVAATTASSEVPDPAIIECSRWDLNGQWQFVQTNETSPFFNLQLTPQGLQGDANYSYWHEDECIFYCGDDVYFVNATVDGWIKGDAFEITAYWNNQTTGVYTGRISPQGRMSGSAIDKLHPQTTAMWYSTRTAKCADGTAGTGERIGNTSSALKTAPTPEAIRAQARVRVSPATAPSRPLSICESADLARARQSPAAPGLEKRCREEGAFKAQARVRVESTPLATTATVSADAAVRRRPSESPVVTKQERFGTGSAGGIGITAFQPENTIKVRVAYRKDLGYKTDTNAFGHVGPTSCDAFSVSVAVSDDSARQRNPIPISSDFKMGIAGDYYVCTYLVSDIPVGQAMRVNVSLSGLDLSAAWNGGGQAQPPAGQQRTIVDATRTALLNATQPRARMSFEMVYGQTGRSR